VIGLSSWPDRIVKPTTRSLIVKPANPLVAIFLMLRMIQIRTLFAIGIAGTLLALGSETFGTEPAQSPSVAQRTEACQGPRAASGHTASANGIESDFDASEHAELHNLIKVTGSIYCGGEPRGDDAMSSLVRIGVKTVVSVDGARPDVETARKHGLRYIHIPIGYEGIDTQAGLALAHLVRQADGPIYIHCHHGQHRGPAAAAIAAIASGGITPGERAESIMRQAGVGKAYAGLWRDVANYQPPGDDAALPELREIAEVGSLTAAMAKIDRAYDHLMLFRGANGMVVDGTAPEGHPDLVAAQEALLLKEGLRESARHLSGKFDEQFREWMLAAETNAGQLEQALKDQDAVGADRHFKTVMESCKACHDRYRN
jgi:protein tyrosine phosphatase (PTP) superfamily phosphohydrolase (DUF442 family)